MIFLKINEPDFEIRKRRILSLFFLTIYKIASRFSLLRYFWKAKKKIFFLRLKKITDLKK